MAPEDVPPGLTCTRCEHPFKGLLARRTPEGFTHVGTCPRYCSIEGCGGKHVGKGYCSPHYQSFKTHGDPLAAKRLTPDHIEDVEWMLQHGETFEGAAKRLRMSTNGLSAFLRVQGRTDVTAAFTAAAARRRGDDVAEPEAELEYEDVA